MRLTMHSRLACSTSECTLSRFPDHVRHDPLGNPAAEFLW
jgi:hypothetical protein